MKLPTEINSGVQIVTHNGVTFVNPSELPATGSWRKNPEPALITGSINIALEAVTRHEIRLHLKNVLIARQKFNRTPLWHHNLLDCKTAFLESRQGIASIRMSE